MSNTQALLGLYAGPDGYARLLDKVAECNNEASRNYYLDLMIDHPFYKGES